MKQFLFVLVMVFQIRAQAGVFVGNGGEGILTPDGKIQLRDLFEAEIEERAIPQGTIDAQIQNRLTASEFLVSEPQLANSMLQVLSEIESREKNAGLFLSEFIVHHRWMRTNLPLKPVVDDSPVDVPEERRVLLANRFQQTIRLNEKFWPALSTFQKTALVVHEMVSAGLRLECTQKYCTQPAPAIREIVAGLFAQTPAGAKAPLKLLARLNVPEKNATLVCAADSAGVEVKTLHGQSIRFTPEQKPGAVEAICDRPVGSVAEVHFTRAQFHASTRSYLTQASDGMEYRQSFSSVEEFVPKRAFKSDRIEGWQMAKTLGGCRALVLQDLNEWFGYDLSTSATTLSCTEIL
jgi:hypothetical protein